jgi:DamX protein
MKSYVQELKLSFDPFDASAISREFFEGGNRREIRDQIVERAMYSESLISVSGCLGSGKSSLLAAITQSFGEEAVVVNIAATLFMSSDQFMDQLVWALQLPGEFESIEDRAHAVTHLAGQLQMDARSLLIQVDDAHDLGGEVLKYLVALKKSAAADSVHVILFGESQLGKVLESTLDREQLAILAEFELGGFGSEATLDYFRFKLKVAGYSYTKLLPLAGSVLGAIHN